MEINRIKNLLEKYFEGQTTLQEEQELLEYFSNEQEIPDSLIRYRPQFSMLKKAHFVDFADQELEDRIARLIDTEEKAVKPVSGSRRLYWLAAAATIIVLIGISALLIYQKTSSRRQDTYSDPQLAYVEAKKTLLYVSEKMNLGIKPLSNVAKINSATSQLKSLEKMDRSLEMLNLVSIINNSSNLKK